jgi:AhpD family alkylhydroperoxidase
MRLTVLDNGHRLRARSFLSLTARMSGAEASDVPKTLLYRPDFLGRALLELSAEMMRGPSFWTAGEREYIAMRTAGWHRCPFCAESHTEMVRLASTGEIDPADPDSARAELTAVLGFLEKVTRTPELVAARDLDAVRAAGVPDAAILDALHVNLVWNVVNRLANAFGFQLRAGQLEKGTRALHRFGYRFPAVLTRGGHRAPLPAGITGRHERLVADLRQSVLDSPARTDPATRAAAATGNPAGESWSDYAALVRDASHRVSDSDIDRLRNAGHREDEIFEITAAAAVGAGLRSLDAGLGALRGETHGVR